MIFSFLMRFDYLEKGGGDVIQIKNYISELDKQGIDSRLIAGSTWLSDVEGSDAVFLVNIDRPIETLNYYDLVKRKYPDILVFVIPIHHPIDAIDKFESEKKGTLSKLLVRTFSDFYTREKIKNIVRFRNNFSMLLLSVKDLFFDYRTRISDMLREVNGVVYISHGEKNSVEADFKVTPKSYCVSYNAVDFYETDVVERSIDFIMVGRIEERKNQFTVLSALRETGYSVKLVGAINSNSDSYARKVLDLVSDSPSYSYAGILSHKEVLELMKKTKVLVNASYFEVNPLIDLEAALAGCNVVTTKYSYTPEVLPDCLILDPWSKESTKDKCIDALNRTLPPDITNISTNWSVSTNEIIKLVGKYVRLD